MALHGTLAAAVEPHQQRFDDMEKKRRGMTTPERLKKAGNKKKSAGKTAGAKPEKFTGLELGDRWSVIGVVGDTHGIAVLKNLASGKTHTLAVGAALPGEAGYAIESIVERRVVLGNGVGSITLGGVETPVAESPPPPDRGERFMENYYRGLQEMAEAAEMAPPLPEREDLDGDAPGLVESLPLAPPPGRDLSGRSRFELFKAEDSYQGEGDAGAVIVNYDNFAEEDKLEDTMGEASDQTEADGEVLRGEGGVEARWIRKPAAGTGGLRPASPDTLPPTASEAWPLGEEPDEDTP